MGLVQDSRSGQDEAPYSGAHEGSFEAGTGPPSADPSALDHEYDWDGLDGDAFSDWQRDVSQIPPSDVERRVLPDLIAAWESGMDTIIVLPYAGYFAKRITRRHLAVSAATRNSTATYSHALREAALS